MARPEGQRACHNRDPEFTSDSDVNKEGSILFFLFLMNFLAYGSCRPLTQNPAGSMHNQYLACMPERTTMLGTYEGQMPRGKPLSHTRALLCMVYYSSFQLFSGNKPPGEYPCHIKLSYIPMVEPALIIRPCPRPGRPPHCCCIHPCCL